MENLSARNKNVVLLKPEVGRQRPATYDLPQDSHFYGKALFRDPTGAREASSEWKYPIKSRAKIPARDFMVANKKAIQNGAYTLKSLSQFKESHIYPEKVKVGTNKVEVRLPEYEFQYGIKNRPSTPIQYVVGNFYGLQSEIQNQQIKQERTQSLVTVIPQFIHNIIQYSLHNIQILYLNKLYPNILISIFCLCQQKVSRSNSSLQPIRNTNSSRFFKNHKMEYIKQIQQEDRPLFKINRFEKVGPRTNTFSQSARSQFNSLMNSQQLKDSIKQSRKPR